MIPETAISIKGQAGGLALARKYGQEHFRNIGRVGGRPRAKTLSVIQAEQRQQQASSAPLHFLNKNEKEERLSNKSLGELKALWKLQKREGGAGIPPASPERRRA